MTQEDKKLLFKDLCARLQYKPHCRVFKLNEDIKENDDVLYGVIGDNVMTLKSNKDECLMYYQIKPYLRPMSSMTLDELDDCVTNDGLRDIPCPNYKGSKEECEQQRLEHSIKVFKTDGYRVDWLNKNMFDYRGLIPMGLALEAPEGMYN